MRYYIDAELRPRTRMPAPQSAIIDADEEQIRKLAIKPKPQPAIIEA